MFQVSLRLLPLLLETGFVYVPKIGYRCCVSNMRAGVNFHGGPKLNVRYLIVILLQLWDPVARQ